MGDFVLEMSALVDHRSRLDQLGQSGSTIKYLCLEETDIPLVKVFPFSDHEQDHTWTASNGATNSLQKSFQFLSGVDDFESS